MVERSAKRETLLLEDFATIFAHMWYRDFPLQPSFRLKAQRADWTTHIGIAVRSTADLMGLFTHFESGGRTDAVLKDNKGNAVAALEWEWSSLHRGDDIITEFQKLKDCCAKEGFRGLRFACLIGYGRGGIGARGAGDYGERTAAVLDKYEKRWDGDLPPLLLVVIHFDTTGQRKAAREFRRVTFDVIKGGKSTPLRELLLTPGMSPARAGNSRQRAADLEALMGEHGTLLYCDEAIRFIERIEDPVTKSLVNMAFVHLVKKVHLEKHDLPRADLDMLFLVSSLKEFFAEHDILARTLHGEKVGAWFDKGM